MVQNSELLQNIISLTRRQGADSADAVLLDSASTNVRERLGKLETVEHAESKALGLRVFVGKQQASISTNDLSKQVLDAAIVRVIEMARAAPEDPYCGLAAKEELATAAVDLDIADKKEPGVEQLLDFTSRMEEAALTVPGVTNSDSAETAYARHVISLAASNGFAQEYTATDFSAVVSVIAGEGAAMETDYEYSIARHFSDLKSAEVIGRSAGEGAVRKLNPRKVATCQVPVIFEAREARNLLSSLASAINGATVSRGMTFLKEKMGARIFSHGVRILDDPLLPRGPASKPFDAEGVKVRRLAVVEDGVLQSWLLDCRSARQLGLRTTGHATRGLSSPPSPSSTNFYMEKGNVTREALLKDIKSGFFVTDVFGMGVNTVTGDYSQGASGFWIENGQIAYPVSEVTIAGHLLDMFMHLTPADDLEFLYTTNAPTVRIEGMTVAGV